MPAAPQACGVVCTAAANGLVVAPPAAGGSIGAAPAGAANPAAEYPGCICTYFVEYTARYWVTGTLTGCWTYCVTCSMHSRGQPVQGSISLEGL